MKRSAAKLSAEQRMRMRRFEVVCQRAIARVRGIPEPSVEDALAARVIELPQAGWRAAATDSVVRFGNAFLRVFQVDRLARIWIARRLRRQAAR